MLSAGVISILLVISNVFTLGIFGEMLAGHFKLGLYEVARYVSIANFFERIDPIVMSVWILLMYCKLATFCYCATLGLAQLLNFKDYRPLIGIVCIFGGIMSQQQYSNSAELSSFFAGAQAIYILIIEVILPPLILMLALLQKRLKKPASG